MPRRGPNRPQAPGRRTYLISELIERTDATTDLGSEAQPYLKAALLNVFV